MAYKAADGAPLRKRKKKSRARRGVVHKTTAPEPARQEPPDPCTLIGGWHKSRDPFTID